MALPKIILPKWMAKIGTKLPGKPSCFVLVSVLSTILKKDLLPADMELFAERKSEIRVLDAGIEVRFSADTERFLDDNFSDTPGLRLVVNGIGFICIMTREEDPDALFFNRKLQIENDTELGLITKSLLDNVEWPFSEWLLKRSTSALDRLTLVKSECFRWSYIFCLFSMCFLLSVSLNIKERTLLGALLSIQLKIRILYRTHLPQSL